MDLENASRFATTRWSLVLASSGPDPGARLALETLCAAYWYPLFAYLRRSGEGPEDAADLVQGFFARLFERGDFARADPERGRFRAFLAAGVKNHARNVHARKRTEKRGGNERIVSLEAGMTLDDAETRYRAEPRDEATPERLFEAAWARALLERVLARLAEDEEARARGPAFALLSPRLFGDADALPLAEVAARLGASEGAVKVALHRLKRRYRDLLSDAVRDTLADPEEVEDELQVLLCALS